MVEMTQSRLNNDQILDIILSICPDLRIEHNSIKGCCPVHGGDNPSALTIYTNKNKWFCWSHSCQEYFGPYLNNLLKGIVSNRLHGWQNPGDTECTQKELEQYIKDINVMSFDKPQITVKSYENTLRIYPERFRSLVKIPSEYYLDRGYSKQILKKYEIGDCFISNKSMFMRAVTPIYDDNYNFIIGYTGRTLYEKCNICKFYHEKLMPCPPSNLLYKHVKWRHSKGFAGSNSLFNLWFAKNHIKNTAILVESTGNVLRLEEADIHIGLGIFGANLSQAQVHQLQNLGIKKLILAFDRDDAGHKATQRVIKRYGSLFDIVNFTDNMVVNDIAEMTKEDICEKMKGLI